MALDGTWRDAQPLADLLIAEAVDDQGQHLPLALAQTPTGIDCLAHHRRSYDQPSDIYTGECDDQGLIVATWTTLPAHMPGPKADSRAGQSKALTPDATLGVPETDPARAAVAAATDQLALTALRIGLLLLAAVTAGDGWVALAAGHNDPALVAVGVLIASVALAGARFPRLAGDLLRPPGRVLLLAVSFTLLGLLQAGLRTQYADVEFGLACVAAIVAAPTWVLAFVVASTLGIAGDFLATGHSLSWTLEGPGSDRLVSQFSVMLAGAAVWVGVIWVLRHSIATAPMSLAKVRRGAGVSLTPRLAAAVRGEPAGLLVRADPSALIEPLSSAESRVLDLLATGLLPKQAARQLELALPTVRSHIASAKRKTGARTLEQLVGLYAEAHAH